MTEDVFKHRSVESKTILGEAVGFLTDNERLRERVANVSDEQHTIMALADRMNPDDVLWDVGACLGIHTFALAKQLPHGEVVAFEPAPSNRGVLMDNLAVNELENVQIVREALASEDGTAEFAIRESLQAGYGRHSLTKGQTEYDRVMTIDVETRRGETLVDDGELPPPNVVKIDVEGSSPLVLTGMADLLRSNSCHTVIVETHEPNDTQPSHEDLGWSRGRIVAYLEHLGFDVSELEKDYHLIGTKAWSMGEALADAELDIEIIQGNIANQSADALVSSAGTTLRMGTGVAGSLRAVGGEVVHLEAISQAPVEPGDVVITASGDLDAEYVIHAASMPHYGDGQSTPESVRTSVRRALTRADEMGCESIVLPAVGCGLGGLSLATGAEIIGDEIARYEPMRNLREARFIAYTDNEYEAICEVLNIDS